MTGNPQEVQTYAYSAATSSYEVILAKNSGRKAPLGSLLKGPPLPLPPPHPRPTRCPRPSYVPSSSVTVFFKGRKKRGETPQTLKGLESSQNLGGKTPPWTFPAGPMAFLRGALGQNPAPMLGFQWKREQSFSVRALREAGWNRELQKHGWPQYPYRDKIISVKILKHCSNKSTKKLVLANKCYSNSNFALTEAYGSNYVDNCHKDSLFIKN